MDKLLLGEILIKRNRLNQEQLTQALELQREDNGFIGEVLVKLGFIDERDVVVALIVQCGLPYIAINKYVIDGAILKQIPKEIVQAEKIVPLGRIGNVLSVVMINPLSESKKAMLEDVTQCRVATFISTKSEIEEAIARLY